MRTTKSVITLLILTASVAATGVIGATLAQQAAPERIDVKARYIKSEYQLTMRDGAKLFTNVYVPRDQSQKYPNRISILHALSQGQGGDKAARGICL